jgi:hypothetical protein
MLQQVYYGTQSGWYEGTARGKATSYVQSYPRHSYVSGTFHHVKLTGLQPLTTYFFRRVSCRTDCSLFRVVCSVYEAQMHIRHLPSCQADWTPAAPTYFFRRVAFMTYLLSRHHFDTNA